MRSVLAFAWLLAATALAGPTWSELPQPVYRSQQARVLDLPRSMDATKKSGSQKIGVYRSSIVAL